MLADYLKDNIQFADSAVDWQAAIRTAAEPIVKNGSALPKYVDAMIENVKENGNYFILLPEIAMAHARPEKGSLKDDLAFLKLKEPVMFPKDVPVSIFWVVAAGSDDDHLEMIASLGELLSDEDTIAALRKVESPEELKALINSQD